MSRVIDAVAVRCAALVDPIAKRKGFTQAAEPCSFTEASDSLNALALRDLVAAASNAACAYAEECRRQGIKPRPEIMALKVPDARELAGEVFLSALLADTGHNRAALFYDELSKRGLRIVFADPHGA